MCDIDNPLYGETGAAYVFAPQKGADENPVKFLNSELQSGSRAIFQELHQDVPAQLAAWWPFLSAYADEHRGDPRYCGL